MHDVESRDTTLVEAKEKVGLQREETEEAVVSDLQRTLSRQRMPNIGITLPAGWDNDEFRTCLMLTDNFTMRLFDFPEEFDDHEQYVNGLWLRFADKIDEFGFKEEATLKFKANLLSLIGHWRSCSGDYQDPQASLNRIRCRLPENQRCLLDGLLSHLTHVDAEEASLMIIDWLGEVETCLSENHGWPI